MKVDTGFNKHNPASYGHPIWCLICCQTLHLIYNYCSYQVNLVLQFLTPCFTLLVSKQRHVGILWVLSWVTCSFLRTFLRVCWTWRMTGLASVCTHSEQICVSICNVLAIRTFYFKIFTSTRHYIEAVGDGCEVRTTTQAFNCKRNSKMPPSQKGAQLQLLTYNRQTVTCTNNNK